jgi:hypothetical protein
LLQGTLLRAAAVLLAALLGHALAVQQFVAGDVK